jgi:hypothetical protein
VFRFYSAHAVATPVLMQVPDFQLFDRAQWISPC